MSLYILDNDKEPKHKNDILISKMYKYDSDKDKLNKKDEKFVYYSDNFIDEKSTKLNCEKNYKFVIEPVKNKNQIFSAYISGQSGSGKSTIANNLIKNLLKNDKSIENVFFITAQTIKDKAFDDLYKMKKKVIRQIKKGRKIIEVEDEEDIFVNININNEILYTTDLDIFKNSIMLFDDYEKLQSKILENNLKKLLERVMNMGRKLNISPIVIRHKTNQGLNTSEILTESQHICLFLKHNFRDCKIFCKNYLGFSEDEINKLRELDTRSLFIRKTIPNYMISDHEIKLF